MSSTTTEVTPTSSATLGCECASPQPQAPGSALCATCGLIFLTSDEYGEHLRRCEAEVAQLLGRSEPEAGDRPSRRRLRRRRRSS